MQWGGRVGGGRVKLGGRILMLLTQIYYYNLEQVQHMSQPLSSQPARQHTPLNFHPYPSKDQTHPRPPPPFRKAQIEFEHVRGRTPQHFPTEASLPHYQNERVPQKYEFAHQKLLQEQSSSALQYFEQGSNNRSKYNDFSFEERRGEGGEGAVRENARKKGTEMKMNNIDQLNGKIYSLLSLIKKEIHKSSSRKKYPNDKSLSPSRPAPDHPARPKDNKPTCSALSNDLNSRRPTCELASLDTYKYPNRSVSGSKPKAAYPDFTPTPPSPHLQKTQSILEPKDLNTRLRYPSQSERPSKGEYENVGKKQFVKRREGSVVMKSIEELLNERRKMLNISNKEEARYSYGTLGREGEGKQEEGSPINDFRNQQKGLETIPENLLESVATPTEANRQKKYQYFIEGGEQNQETLDETSLECPSKAYKKYERHTPKRTRTLGPDFP